jgi:aminomethyltransferase
MSRIPVGRNRFDAVPKEQPPRKLSGKRTTGDYRNSGEKLSVMGARRRDNNLRRKGQRGLEAVQKCARY